MLLRHGLDILAVPLDSELIKPLTIDRNLPGFEGFTSAGNRAIESSQPSHSLLYHALASPEVTLDEAGQPLQLYPTPAEIEAILDYVYGVNPPTLEDLQRKAEGAPLALVVFASEYRCAGDTVHGEHADLCFSRTGIARVGTVAAHYDAQRRCFLPFVDDDVHGIRVMPVRYSAYIAMQHKGNAARFGPMDFQDDVDAGLDFWVPLHKLFEGTQCLAGMDLTLELDNYQINEKLRYVHRYYEGTAGWQEPEISQPPFVITDGLAVWATQADLGPGLLLPQPKSRLVELAYYQGKPLSFQVPRGTSGIVHARHQVSKDGQIKDLNDREGVDEIVRQGGYRALHYHDGMADGWVRAHCPSLENSLPSVAAYSVIGAPDFFPLCSQRQLIRWANTEPNLPTPPDIWHTKLEALSNIRYCANLSLKDQPFSADDRGVTAIVALPREAGSTSSSANSATTVARPSSLPDAAAGVFGPGWELGRVFQLSEDNTSLHFLAGYKLASPFSEDVRICAALSSFWPGVAPDSARTFEPRGSLHTIIPLTDQEIGQTGGPAWDNQRGPRLVEQAEGRFVQYHAYEYTDYTQVALDGGFSLQLTGNTTLQDYEDRVLSMNRVYNVLGVGSNKPERNKWPILSFTFVHRPDEELDTAEQEAGLQLSGWVHRYQLYERGLDSTRDIDFKLRNVEILHQATLLVSAEAILVKHDESSWQIAK
ncbi:hypothetical protein [Pseudomonas sp. IT-P258]|uniref:hypothetical protein n=1 Tax=Pseudomonas sp. IT-P258 TaxID=3026447 RepID=UPI0039DF3FD8